MMTLKQKETRAKKLYAEALLNYTSNNDFYPFDCLNDKKAKEYRKLLLETGQATETEKGFSYNNPVL